MYCAAIIAYVSYFSVRRKANCDKYKAYDVCCAFANQLESLCHFSAYSARASLRTFLRIECSEKSGIIRTSKLLLVTT